MKKIVLASSNQGKLIELKDMFSSLSIDVVSQADFNITSPEETGLSFIENAILKARYASKHSGLPALADDSGLEVLALNGAPGIHSARYSGENASDEKNNQKLLAALAEVPENKRQANFRCCLALVRHELDPCPVIAEGIWSGSIAFEAIGENGFGYDPLFLIEGSNLSSAQLDKKEKNKISHRALALKKLLPKLEALTNINA